MSAATDFPRMAVERSNKRRKIDTAQSTTINSPNSAKTPAKTPARTPARPPARTSARSSTTKASSRATRDLTDEEKHVEEGTYAGEEGPTIAVHSENTISVDSCGRSNSRSQAAEAAQEVDLQPKTPTMSSIQCETTSGTSTTRASGRARKLSAKLQGDTTPVVQETRARLKARTSMTAKQSKARIAKAGFKQDGAIEVPVAEKENVTPSGSVSPDNLVILKAREALQLHDELMIDTEGMSQEATQALDIFEFGAHTQQPDSIPEDHTKWTPATLSHIQQSLLAQITGATPVELIGLDDEYQKVHEIVNTAVETGESNSMILIGSRGSGKSALVDHVLRAQRERYPDDFHTIRLNGFIHTDDKLALRDIWRQLGKDMEPDVDEDTIHSYADTLAMLLALLSDPEELGTNTKKGHTAKSVIFVLDEFDLFATHPRQTLLYNLFDIAQSRKAPIAVLGLTTRVDIVEALEKRVKSRFSHRYVHFGLAKSFTVFTDSCLSFLKLSTSSPMSEAWTSVVDALQKRESFQQHISKIYYRSKSIANFLSMMLIPLASLPVQRTLITAEIIEHLITNLSIAVLGPDSKLDLLSSLSSLQLALLICAARQSAIYNTDNVTFNLVYEEYKNLAGKAKLQASASGAMNAGGRVLGKDVAKNAWYDLANIGFVLEDGRGVGRVDIALEEISDSGVDLGQWARWCKEI